MAIVTNTYTTYDSVGNREDLIGVISNISPKDTWFQSNIGNARATGRYHEWLKDALAAPASNAIIEGTEYAATAITPATRTGNYCQGLRKTFSITDIQEVVDKAGRDSEIAYQKANKLAELANDIEYALLVNSSAVSGATGTARQLKGLAGWITSNVTSGTGTESQPMTETLLTDNLQAVWKAGGKPSNALMGAFQKRKIDAFTTNTRNVNADEKKLIANISVYESAFGIISLRLHHVMEDSLSDRIFILGQMDLWKKAWLAPVKTVEAAKTAASRMFAIEAWLTLEARQEASAGVIDQLTTS